MYIPYIPCQIREHRKDKPVLLIWMGYLDNSFLANRDKFSQNSTCRPPLFLPKVQHFYCPSVEILQGFAIFGAFLQKIKMIELQNVFICWGCFWSIHPPHWSVLRSGQSISNLSRRTSSSQFFIFQKIYSANFQRKFQRTLKYSYFWKQ